MNSICLNYGKAMLNWQKTFFNIFFSLSDEMCILYVYDIERYSYNFFFWEYKAWLETYIFFHISYSSFFHLFYYISFMIFNERKNCTMENDMKLIVWNYSDKNLQKWSKYYIHQSYITHISRLFKWGKRERKYYT